METMGDQAEVELRLFGPIALSRDGVEATLPASRKTRALLAYLATSGRAERRERLCDLFWELPDDPRGSLRWSLSKLRVLVGERLIADRETVRLDLDGAAFDWRDLRVLARDDFAGAPTETLDAAARAGGDLLEGLDLPRCDDFQAWCTAQREDARRLRTGLLAALIGRSIEREQALGHAREWVRLDPFDPVAQVALAGLLDSTGRRAEAEEQRARGIRRLDEAAISVPGELRRAPPRHAAAPLPEQRIRFCSASDGTKIAWASVGEGLPLVKTANWLSHLEYDWNSPIWGHWLRALSDRRRLIRYDQRGNGLSDWDAADLSLDAFVDDLESVVGAAELDRFDLLGVSQGCSTAIAYAVKHPERVRRLILFGGYAAGWRVRSEPGDAEMRAAMITLTRQGWGQNNPAFRQMFTTLFFPDAPPAYADWFNELQRISTSAENAERLQNAFAELDVRRLLDKVAVPTLVLHARDDAMVPFAAGRGMAARIPGAQFVPLDSRNHMPLENEPAWPALLGRISAFLA